MGFVDSRKSREFSDDTENLRFGKDLEMWTCVARTMKNTVQIGARPADIRWE